MPDHLEAARYVIQGLGHVLADPAQGTATMRAGAGRWVQYFFTRKMVGQWPARRLLRLERGLDRRRHDRRGDCQALGLIGLQGLDRQLELLDLARQLLRGASELGPAVTRQLELQFGDLGPRRYCVARHIGNDLLQRSDVIGQALGRCHEPDYLMP